jgi:hypothetical protein
VQAAFQLHGGHRFITEELLREIAPRRATERHATADEP